MSTITQQTFTLTECTPSDVPAMKHVYLSAFADDYLMSYIIPRAAIGDEELNRWLDHRFTAYFSKREVHTFKITEDQTGTMAAFLRVTFPHVLTEEEKTEREKETAFREEKKKKGRDSAWPVGANLALVDEKFGALDRMQEQYVDKANMYTMNLLATDPKYQKRGLAKRLMTHVIEMADEEDRYVYIEATPSGHPVYLQLGFADLDVVYVDVRKWGGKEPGNNKIMIRCPKTVLKTRMES